MIEAACVPSSRKGAPVKSEDLTKFDLSPDEGTEAGDIPAIDRAVPDDVAEAADVPTVAAPEHSHPGESMSNGLAEVSVRDFEDHARTLDAALESRMGERNTNTHPHHRMAGRTLRRFSHQIQARH